MRCGFSHPPPPPLTPPRPCRIKLHVVRVGSDLRLHAATVAKHVNANTAIIVASAPGFPHGLVDHVQVRGQQRGQ